MPCGRKKHLPEFMATLTQGAPRETQTAAGKCKTNTSPSFQRVGFKPVKKKPQISADSQFRKNSKQNYKSSGCCRCCIGKLKETNSLGSGNVDFCSARKNGEHVGIAWQLAVTISFPCFLDMS